MSKPETFLAGNSRLSRVLYRCVWTGAVAITRCFTRMTIDGKQHIPASGAFVLAPVHRSYVDTPIAACVTRRRMRFMGKDSMWNNRQMGWLFSALGAFPVSRGTADREALKRSIVVLEAGEPLVLFPEGERKDGPAIQPLFQGAAYVAIKAGVPIVPVGIGGSAKVMPRGAKIVYPRKVHVVIGEPIAAPVSESGRVPRRAVSDLTEQLHGELQVLFDEAMERVGWSYPPEAVNP